MSPVTRRQALQCVGAATVGCLAGCTVPGQGSTTEPRIGDLFVTNFDSSQYTVHVLLLEGDDPVYWSSRRVPPAEDGQSAGATFEGYPTEPGNYVLHVRRDGQPPSEGEQLDFAEHDTTCLGVLIRIGFEDEEERAGELSLLKTTERDVCAEGTTHSRSAGGSV